MKQFLVSLVLLVMTASNCWADERPNIVFAIADDWGWPHASIYGNDEICQTPAFDRIATGGLLFNHAYVASPNCTPSRNAILTGQYFWRLGSGANLWSTLDTKHKTYPQLLEDAGYHIGHWRKSWGPGNLDNWDRHPAGKQYKHPDEFFQAWDRSQPFCFWLGTSDPHRSYEAGSGKASGMDLSKIKLFDHFPDQEQIRSDVADYYFEVQRFDRDVGKLLTRLEELISRVVFWFSGQTLAINPLDKRWDLGQRFVLDALAHVGSIGRDELPEDRGNGVAFQDIPELANLLELAPTGLPRKDPHRARTRSTPRSPSGRLLTGPESRAHRSLRPGTGSSAAWPPGTHRRPTSLKSTGKLVARGSSTYQLPCHSPVPMLRDIRKTKGRGKDIITPTALCIPSRSGLSRIWTDSLACYATTPVGPV